MGGLSGPLRPLTMPTDTARPPSASLPKPSRVMAASNHRWCQLSCVLLLSERTALVAESCAVLIAISQCHQSAFFIHVNSCERALAVYARSAMASCSTVHAGFLLCQPIALFIEAFDLFSCAVLDLRYCQASQRRRWLPHLSASRRQRKRAPSLMALTLVVVSWGL